MTPHQIAPHVFQIALGFVNAYAITTPDGEWVLVDCGLKQTVSQLQTLSPFFGKSPRAIVLTHGHLDHAGGARELAKTWNCRVYVGALERPFLSGKAVYPPKDPTVGGALAFLSRFSPWPMFNLTGLLENVPQNGEIPELPDWKILATPGHTPGHLALWNERERVLLAGDALCTLDADSWLGILTQKPVFARPGTPFTTDWNAARQSVQTLAALEPQIVAAGHGQPISGGETAQKLRDFAANFPIPPRGRYANQSAIFDENGPQKLPPEPPDDFNRNLQIAAALATIVALFLRLRRR